MTAYADPLLLSTPCAADVTILFREGTAQRLLKWMWNVSACQIADAGRGTVWICREWLARHLGVSRGALRQALSRLRRMRWIADTITTDDTGQLCEGFAFAKRADQGFENGGETVARRSRDGGETVARRSYTTVKTKLSESSDQTAAMSRDTRQTGLNGPGFEAPTQPAQATEKRTKAGNMKRDSRLHDIAVRVDEYERARYEQHPRCVRPKRNTPDARVLSVEAITRALERVVATEVYPTLEDLEMRFRAVVELNWDGAERKLETWEWWTGSAMWAPMSLERCLGWLDESRNEIYLLRARGVLVLPQRPTGEEPAPVDMTGLSPVEQQAEYDRQFGGAAAESIEELIGDIPTPSGPLPPVHTLTHRYDNLPDIVVGGDEAATSPESIEDYRWETVGDDRVRKEHQGPGPYVEWHSEQEAAKQLSDCIDRGDAPGLDELVRGMMVSDWPDEPTVDQLVRAMRAKTAYVNGTTAEERRRDALAGRKPWDVG